MSLYGSTVSSKHGTFNQCCFDVGPSSTTLGQHQTTLVKRPVFASTATITNLTTWPGEAERTVTLKICLLINTRSMVETRCRVTGVDVVLTVLARVTLGTLTGVRVHSISTGTTVQARAVITQKVAKISNPALHNYTVFDMKHNFSNQLTMHFSR